jgi:hypothetical protein
MNCAPTGSERFSWGGSGLYHQQVAASNGEVKNLQSGVSMSETRVRDDDN